MQTARSLTLIALLCASCATPALTFGSPQDALQALVDSAEDATLAEQLLGPGGFDMLCSGDPVADAEDVALIRTLIRQKLAFEDTDTEHRVAVLGDDAWPLPIPLVREGDRWRFDVEAGRDEILNRRIGRNELSTIATLRACVEAQIEYAAVGRDGKAPSFASRWASGEGEHDGLYWPAEDDEAESPLGPLVADAAAAGYRRDESGTPVPYHGYYFHILTEQGPAAPGGARSYLDADGALRSGFAFLAWPATYGNSGVMSFMVNQQGIVFERDLGDDTAQLAQQIKAYSPDESWRPVGN